MAEDDRPVGDKSTITATQWEAAALAFAALTLIFAFFGIIWIIGWIGGAPDTPDSARARAQVFTAGFAALAAIVTFCTVAWRAKVTERQADIQEVQASAQERQLRSVDENNQALLLQKGAELIAEKTEAKNLAGIACLSAIVTAENRRFGTEGMSLLARYLHTKNPNDFTTHLPRATTRALKAGFRNGNSTTAILSINGGGKSVRWEPVWGIQKIYFRNGIMYGFKNGFREGKTPHLFHKVTFRGANIFIDLNMFSECHFTDCKILDFKTFPDDENTYHRCDFSGCKMYTDPSNSEIAEKLSGNDNFYLTGTPPLPIKGFENFDWREFLREEREVPLFDDKYVG